MATTAITDFTTKIDHRTNSISMKRSFVAPRERIFEAWTVPEHITCWWDPTGAPLAKCEVDLRPGGRFIFANQGTRGVPAFGGVYREIAPPERLVFEAMGSIGTVELEDLGGRTLMTVTIRCGSPEQLKHFVHLGVDVDTSRTLDNLVDYVGHMLS